MSTDVCIVGAGPVGLVLGILLAQRGRSVEIVEQWPSPYTLPRAVHFDHEVGRILQACGIGDRVRAISEPAEVYEWRNAAGTTLLRFGRVGVAASGWPFSSMFCQPELEAALRQRAESLLTIRRGTRVTGLDRSGWLPSPTGSVGSRSRLEGAGAAATEVGDDRVVAHCVPVTSTGDERLAERPDAAFTIDARYVVGCDGANSTVRRLLGIDIDDRGFNYDWLIVDVILDEARLFDPLNLQICDPARPTTAVSGGPGRRRWEFMRLPLESLDDLATEARAWDLLAPWDVHPGNARLERHAVYTFQARVAQQWQAGRVFLAGDAAHLMPPFAGQGMCSGLRDAANLAWKLDLVLGGQASTDLLATYDDERRPSANAAVDFSIELGQVICVPDPAEAAARDEAMAAGVDGSVSEAPPSPGLDAGVIAAGTPAAGEQFPQARVGDRWFDDVHGAGWRMVSVGAAFATVIAFGVDQDDADVDPVTATGLDGFDPRLVDWFTSIGGAFVAVVDAPDLSAWFDKHGVAWALQRPDFHVYGTAASAGSANALLASLRADLTRSTSR